MGALSEAVWWDFLLFWPPQPAGLMAHRWRAKVCVQYKYLEGTDGLGRSYQPTVAGEGQTVKVWALWCKNWPNKMLKPFSLPKQSFLNGTPVVDKVSGKFLKSKVQFLSFHVFSFVSWFLVAQTSQWTCWWKWTALGSWDQQLSSYVWHYMVANHSWRAILLSTQTNQTFLSQNVF